MVLYLHSRERPMRSRPYWYASLHDARPAATYLRPETRTIPRHRCRERPPHVPATSRRDVLPSVQMPDADLVTVPLIRSFLHRAAMTRRLG